MRVITTNSAKKNRINLFSVLNQFEKNWLKIEENKNKNSKTNIAYFSMHDNLLGLNFEFSMSFVSLPV